MLRGPAKGRQPPALRRGHTGRHGSHRHLEKGRVGKDVRGEQRGPRSWEAWSAPSQAQKGHMAGPQARLGQKSIIHGAGLPGRSWTQLLRWQQSSNTRRAPRVRSSEGALVGEVGMNGEQHEPQAVSVPRGSSARTPPQPVTDVAALAARSPSHGWDKGDGHPQTVGDSP